MKIFSALSLLCLLSLASSSYGQDQNPVISDSPNSKIVRNEDGTQSHYKKDSGQQGMVRSTYDASGRLVNIIIYETTKEGQLIRSKVYDGKKNELFKVSYGYDIHSRLREEHMFDSRKIDPATGKNLLVRRFIYTYDSAGNRSRPMAIVLVKGYEKVNTSVPQKDPF